MKIGKTLYVVKREKWREWLGKFHDKEKEIWLISYRKDSRKVSIPYNDAVEEALCFGWIDSLEKKFNEDSSVQRYSPRNPKSQWSEANKKRVRRLLKEGRMTPSGLAKLGDALKQ